MERFRATSPLPLAQMRREVRLLYRYAPNNRELGLLPTHQRPNLLPKGLGTTQDALTLIVSQRTSPDDGRSISTQASRTHNGASPAGGCAILILRIYLTMCCLSDQ